MTSAELHPTTVAWVKAAQAATAEIRRLEEVRQRAIEHIQNAMGDSEQASWQGQPVVSWAWSKPAQRLDRRKLEEAYGAEEIARYLVDNKPSRPFRLLRRRVTTFAQPAAGWIKPPLEGPAGALATSVIETVKHAAANAPRSLQAAPGPSGLGTPCTRRLAYMALDWEPKPNSDTDPWASIQGIAVHAWMAATYRAENARLGRERYLIEHRIHLPGGITGSTDLYDRDTTTNVDWKVTGAQRLREYRKNGPGEQYQAQAHLYALGLQLAGEQPTDVAIVFLPRGGRIDELWPWSEPYDPGIAVKALDRYQAIQQFHITVDPEAHPERWQLLPTADAHCTWCPWFLPGSADLSQGCPGHNTI